MENDENRRKGEQTVTLVLEEDIPIKKNCSNVLCL